MKRDTTLQDLWKFNNLNVKHLWGFSLTSLEFERLSLAHTLNFIFGYLNSWTIDQSGNVMLFLQMNGIIDLFTYTPCTSSIYHLHPSTSLFDIYTPKLSTKVRTMYVVNSPIKRHSKHPSTEYQTLNLFFFTSVDWS